MTSQWAPSKSYAVGNVVLYDKLYYKCIQAHTSQSDWMPCIDTLSIWQPISVPVATPTPIPVPIPTPMPTPAQNLVFLNKDVPLLAPYLYTWGKGNPIYKINSFADVKTKLAGNAATLAFVTNKSVDELLGSFSDDIKAFIKNGGKPIISFGGANGPYMEDVISESEMIAQINRLIEIGITALDFDIEGSYNANIELNAKRDRIIVALQKKFPNLYISFTLPADPNGLPDLCINMIKTSIKNGVKISVINIMAMDIGRLPVGFNWGQIAEKMGNKVVDQMRPLYNYPNEQLYKMLGITVMIGKNDDDSVFLPSDMTYLAKYATNKNIGLLSYWAINRDQVKKTEDGYAIYSLFNNKDYEYYLNAKNVLDATKPVVKTCKCDCECKCVSC